MPMSKGRVKPATTTTHDHSEILAPSSLPRIYIRRSDSYIDEISLGIEVAHNWYLH